MAESIWNDDEKVERLIALWNQGLSVTQIARDLGTSRGSVSSKRQRLNLSPRDNPLVQKWYATPEKIAIAKHLRKIGLSYQAIADRLGVTNRTAMIWVAKEVEEETV